MVAQIVGTILHTYGHLGSEPANRNILSVSLIRMMKMKNKEGLLYYRDTKKCKRF